MVNNKRKDAKTQRFPTPLRYTSAPLRELPLNLRSARVFVGLSVLLAHWLLTACNVPPAGPSLAQPLTELLPDGWVHTGAWHNINLDNDDPTEYLLFYTYDGVAINGLSQSRIGPIGALILDPIEPSGVAPVPVDASDSYTATVTAEGAILAVDEVHFERVLPGYWPGQGQGFIAAPGEEGGISVQLLESIVADPNGPVQDVVLKELLILAGGTRMTVVWWRGPNLGYGVAQVHGSAGLYHSIEGATTTAVTEPLSSVWADTPLNDRNNLCLRSRYDRMLKFTNSTDVPFASHDAISYAETAEGIRFCYGAPFHPFYPEGVVLAYLQNPQSTERLLFPELGTEQKERILQMIKNLWSGETPPRVDALLGYQWWPTTLEVGQRYIETAVCATVQTTEGAQSLLFNLRHAVEQGAEPQPINDRLYILNVAPIPAPAGSAAADCRNVIGAGAPNSRGTP